MTQSTYGNSDTVSYVYDSPGRVTGIKHNGETSYTWTYSGSGIPNSFTDNVSGKKYQYTYDSLGRLIYQSGKSTSGSNRSSSAYKYDIADNLTQITNTAGTLGVSAWYHYDNVNRPTKSYFNTAAEHNYVYDKLGRLESADVKLSGNTVNRDFTYYDSATRNTGSTAYTTTQLKTETIGDRGYTYTYDNVGNIIAITEKTTANGSYSPKASYIYDSLGQLIRENNKDLNKTVVYSYDNGGNITSVKEYAYTTGTVGTATKTINYTYDSAWKDKLVSYDGQSITYDGIGNPLTYRDGMSFTWFARQMETADVNGTAITYKYDADGLRTEKKVGNTVHEYEYTGSTLFYENRGGIQLHYRYDVNGNLASITRIKADGTKFTLYAICNSRGDVEELRTLAGDLYARYVYDTWGNTLHIYNASGAEITDNNNLAKQNPLRYRGYYFDAETGFYYLQSRYYDPVTHRFLNADRYVSTGQNILGTNMFSYCSNSPVIYVDPFGEKEFECCPYNNCVYCQKEKKNGRALSGHVEKSHITTPKAMLDCGPLIGKVGTSTTVTIVNNEIPVVYSFTDIGNDVNMTGGGLNLFDVLGAEIGVNSDYNAYIDLQITPWLHGSFSIGANGIGICVGYDVENVAHNFEFYGGWGAILFAVSPQLFAEQVFSAPPQLLPA